MKRIGLVTSFLLLAIFAGPSVASTEDGLSAELRQVVEDNVAAYNRDEVSAALQSVHTKSPDYATMQQALPTQFSAMNIGAELVNFHYIGHDDEFALARVEIKTVDKSGEPFVANVLDTIAVFHQEGGEWKYWSNLILGVHSNE